MESRIEKIEDTLVEISYRLDFHEQTNDTQFKSFKETSNAVESSLSLAKKFISEFELVNLKLKNAETEIETLNTEIRILKIYIETINTKLDIKY